MTRLEENLRAVRARIDAAARAAGRDPAAGRVIAISKTWPASDVLLLHSLGVSDFGESYDQEAAAKSASLAAMGCRPTWHFVTPADIRWLLALTGPRIHIVNRRCCRNLGLNDRALTRARSAGTVTLRLPGSPGIA